MRPSWAIWKRSFELLEMRAITSYMKVQSFLGNVLRNKAWLLRPEQWHNRRFLNLGCGPFPEAGFVNLDYRWRPGIDVVWDVLRPLPFPEARFDGVFSEHCLEHFDLAQLGRVLRELHRVLAPAGVARIVVPDLAKYAEAYSATRREGAGHHDERLCTAAALNRVFYSGHVWMSRSRWWNDGHHFIHDFESLSALLREAGFTDIRECGVRDGAVPELLVDREDQAWESLYVEATKPAEGA